MKWGKKKSYLPSSPRPSLISSWLLKFKKMSSNSERKPGKEERKWKWNSTSMNSLQCADGGGGRFYGGDDDAFWRLSFGEESVDGKKSRGGLKSVWYDSDDELEIPPSSYQSCRSIANKVGREETQKLSGMVSDVRKTRDLHRDVEILPAVDNCKREKETDLKTPRRGIAKDRRLRKANGRVSGEKLLASERGKDEAKEREIFELQPGRTIWLTERDKRKLTASDSKKHRHVFSRTKSRNSNLRTIEEDSAFAYFNSEEPEKIYAEDLSLEWQKLKEMKIEELKSKCEKRRSLYVSRELQRSKKQSSKVRVYSPRTASKVEICKIKYVEDMKKAKLKMKKKAKGRAAEVKTGLESFAVVKCSFDPQQDFRDSMIEMIMEKKIRQPEELEELLACYLTLNSDEYHDLIIKVFRQVWYDMNQACFGTELPNENTFYV